jgi:hypothetical protein
MMSQRKHVRACFGSVKRYVRHHFPRDVDAVVIHQAQQVADTIHNTKESSSHGEMTQNDNMTTQHDKMTKMTNIPKKTQNDVSTAK